MANKEPYKRKGWWLDFLYGNYPGGESYKYVASIAPIDPISVAFGTEFNNIGLPEEVSVTLIGGDIENLPVSWIQGLYDPETPGSYNIAGVLILPDGYFNPGGLVASIEIIVEEDTTGIIIPDLVFGIEAIAEYAFEGDELNEPPYAEDFYLLGGNNVGDEITAVIEGLVIPNGAAEGTHIYRWYRSLNRTASYEEAIVATDSYVADSGDVGWYLRAEVDLVQADGTGQNLVGETLKSAYTDLIIDPDNFSPFADISTWDTALDKSTASQIATQQFWVNRASVDSNALPGVTAIPTWDGAKNAVRFTRASSQSLRIQAAGSYAVPFEFWIKFTTPTSFGGVTQALAGFSGSHLITINSSGTLLISNVSTGQTLATNTSYVLRVVFNGASSSWTLNNGSVNSISISTNAVGTPNWRLGCQFNDTNYFDGWIEYVFLNDAGLSAGDITDMWTWL